MIETLPQDIKLLPYDQAAELAVLGALLLNDNAMAVVEGILTEDDFYLESHAQVYGAIVRMTAAGRSVDAVTVSAEVPKHRGLIMAACDTLSVVANLREHCTIVAKLATLRRVIEAGRKIEELGFDTTRDVDETLDEAEETLVKIRPESGRRGGLLSVSAMQVFDEVSMGEAPSRLSTGFRDLDRKIGGLYGGNLVIIGARPGVGKTALGMAIANHVGKHGAVAFFSLEMSQYEIAQRTMSCYANVPLAVIRDRTPSPDQLADLLKAQQKIAAGGVRVYDEPAMTPGTIRHVVRTLSAKHDVKLIVVDYLQLLTMGRRTEARHVEVAAISRELKALARETHCPVIALSQLNRESENPFAQDSKPKISQLRESGAIEQDADMVFLMSQPKEQDDPFLRGAMLIDIQKNRHGETGEVYLTWEPTYTRFSDR